jgi:hypothetical protein
MEVRTGTDFHHGQGVMELNDTGWSRETLALTQQLRGQDGAESRQADMNRFTLFALMQKVVNPPVFSLL